MSCTNSINYLRKHDNVLNDPSSSTNSIWAYVMVSLLSQFAYIEHSKLVRVRACNCVDVVNSLLLIVVSWMPPSV